MSDKFGVAEDDVLRLHEALQVLAQADENLAQVLELRYFGGLTEPEIAEAMGISERSVRRKWEKPPFFSPPSWIDIPQSKNFQAEQKI
ncbi:MAG: ECF-type sigma factor [Comamonadaceae bacterium]